MRLRFLINDRAIVDLRILEQVQSESESVTSNQEPDRESVGVVSTERRASETYHSAFRFGYQ